MRILGLITARGGSKEIPGKNIKPLHGKPLLGYVAGDGLNSSTLSKFIISTDDQKIADVARDFGVEVPFLRPKELAADDTPSIDVLRHALRYFDEEGDHYDAVCLLQPTSPYKPEGFIDKCVHKFMESEADCLISVLPVPHQFSPYWTFKPNDEGFLNFAAGDVRINRRQDLPETYYRDGSVYVVRRDIILNHSSLLSGRISYMVSNMDYYCNLDTMDDWRHAESNSVPKG